MYSPLKSCMDATAPAFDARRNFGEYMVQHLRRHAGSKLINGTSHKAITYSIVAEQVGAVRAALCRLGLNAGDKILLLSANRMQLLPMLLGAACANVACVSESPGFSADVVADAMQTLSLACVCCEPDRIDEALEIKQRLPSIKYIIAMDEPKNKIDGAVDCVITWNELLQKGRAQNGTTSPPVEYREDTICYMTSTSGTTGRPKLVVHCHESLVALIQSNSHPMHMGLGPQDVSLSTTSLGHVYALYDGVCKAIAQGASAAFMETAESSAIFEAIYKHRVTALTTTPYTVRCLLDDDRRHSYDLQSLQYVTTATTCIGEDVVQAVIREFNLKTFIQLYGQSEIPLISAGLYNAPTNGKSIGCLAFGVEAMVRDTETRQPVGPWQREELVLRSPSLMRGYWGRLHEPITDEDGWYRTGDQCYYDNDGWLYLVARLSDFYCCRGSKFWPSEVEAVLFKCPGVHDCAVVGIPHPEAGEVAHALVVPEPRARALSAEHITQFVEANAPKGCHLEGGVTFVDKIPRNNLGKLVRRQLVQWILANREL
nr:4-coumarate--CoA ligase 1-like [Rhipicephalus microplus]